MSLSSLAEKFQRLDTSQQSITSVSKYLQYLNAPPIKIAETWQSEFQKGNSDRKLALLYVLNDFYHAIQKQPTLSEFIESFSLFYPLIFV